MSFLPDPQIKALVFDLGNVLIDFDHGIAARRIMQFTDKDAREIAGLFLGSGLTGLFEEGKISPEEFFSQVKGLLALRLEYREFLPIWNEIFNFSEKNRRVYDLAKRLQGRYRLAVLSNSNILHFEYVKNKFPIFAPFQQVFVSYQMGLAKPDPLIYQKVLQALGARAEEVFYTDDRLDLVESARTQGFRAEVFRGVDQLCDDLRKAGVEVD